MKGYDASTYGERVAGVYDRWYQAEVDPRPAATFLAGLLGPEVRREALELGVGTGRVAIALSTLGVAVTGIDASPAMLARLREKPGGESIRALLGDFAEVPVDGTFPLVYVAFNTLFWLTEQQAQLRCLQNVARCLEVGGYFVLDAFVPDVTPYAGGQRMTVTEILGRSVTIDVSRHDSVQQTLSAAHLELRAGQPPRIYPVLIRYAWPSEIDALAASAGLTLVERWADYAKGCFDGKSRQHVSVYTPAG